jgi:hypothetical protein
MQVDPIGTAFNFENLNSPISAETAVVSWLRAIETLSKDGSFESRETVLDLAKVELPDCESFPEDLRDAINKIKTLAQSKNWDPTLSPNASKLLTQICQNYTQSKAPKPNCAKKLNF